MCVSPVSLYNTSEQHYLAQRLLFNVPCGKCYECLDKKAQDYYARCYYQFLETKEKGGFSFFDTLTYSNECCPVTEVVNHDTGELVKFQHFCSADISYFIKKLRIYLTRAGYVLKDNFKFFLSCEYGHTTHRPHYHVIFFCNVPRLTDSILKRFINKAWDFGFTDRRISKLCVITDFRAAKYVTKYITKKDEYLDYLFDLFGSDVPDITFQWQPFTRCSPGLGFENIVKNMSDDMTINVPTKNGIIAKSISAYVKRKLTNDTYYCYRNGRAFLRWKPNQLGYDLKLKTVNLQIKRLEQYYISLCETLKNIKTYDLELKHIKSMLGKRTFYDLATYQIVYQGNYMPLFMMSKFSNNCPDVPTMIKWQFCPNVITELEDTKSSSLSYVNESFSPCFVFFDCIIALIRQLQLPFRKAQSEGKKRKEQLKSIIYAQSS